MLTSNNNMCAGEWEPNSWADVWHWQGFGRFSWTQKLEVLSSQQTAWQMMLCWVACWHVLSTENRSAGIAQGLKACLLETASCFTLGIIGKGPSWRTEGKKGLRRPWLPPPCFQSCRGPYLMKDPSASELWGCKHARVRNRNTVLKEARESSVLLFPSAVMLEWWQKRNTNGIFPDYCKSYQYREKNASWCKLARSSFADSHPLRLCHTSILNEALIR